MVLLRVLPRGGRRIIEGLTVGGLGGAFSVDYQHRTKGRDWWPNEEPSHEEAEALIARGPLDILITHDAPDDVPLKGDFHLSAEQTEKANITRRLLREVVDALAVPHLFCGHWHQRRIHELSHSNGKVTIVDALDMENSRHGIGVLVWPEQAPLRIEPLEIRNQ